MCMIYLLLQVEIISFVFKPNLNILIFLQTKI